MNLRKAISVIVLERAGDRWKVVEAAVAAGGIVIRRARLLSDARTKPGEATEPLPALSNRAQVILVAGSDRSVCRRIQAPAASDEDTRRMVALRLETELPYPVEKSFWVCERLNGSAEGESPVLMLAIPRAEVADAEQALGFTGRNPWAVQLDAGALAELARASQKTPEETAAVCRIEERTTDLVIVRHGRLEYARRIFAGLPAAASSATAEERESEAAGEPTARLGDELDQCIHHYALDTLGGGVRTGAADRHRRRRGHGRPDRAGARPAAESPGRPLRHPARHPGDSGDGRRPWLAAGLAKAETLPAQFPACLGALIAAQRAMRGEGTAAPALRRRKTPVFAALPRRRMVLAGFGAALLCALIALSFFVRRARYDAASRAVRQGLPFLQDMDRLQNEVDALEHEKSLARHPMLDTLLALVETLPKGMQIATLSVSPAGKIALSGVCGTVEDASEKAVTALKASKMFANPKFLGVSKSDQGLKFRMTFEIRNFSGVGDRHEPPLPEEIQTEAGK